jgi:hypothetical protein
MLTLSAPFVAVLACVIFDAIWQVAYAFVRWINNAI